MSYLEKLKSLKTPTQVTVLTALSPLGSKGSTPQRHFPAKKTLRAVKAVHDGGIFQENEPGTPSTGACLICGVSLDQDGGDCWHKAFHMGVQKPSPQTEPISCFSCGHYDGKGAAWPGMCRYFETIGQAAKEIDFNVIDPVTGCKCYMARAFTPELVSSITRQRLHGDDPGYVLLDSSKKEIRAKQVERISIVAAAWLNENKVQLRLHDWTMAELYRRNLSRGIAWSPVWSMFGLTITIEGTGCICFEYSTTTGQKIRQTAFPKRSPSKRRLDS